MSKITVIFGILLCSLLLSSCGIDFEEMIDRFMLDNYADRTELLEDGRMHVVLVGTGGPMASERRVSQCTAILAGGEFLLIDAGPGSARRSSLLKLPGAHLSGILLTHYHSDHIGDLGEINTQSWIDGRTESLEVFGPEGVDDIVNGFNTAYERDVLYRNVHHGEQYMPYQAGTMRSTTITLSDPQAPTLFFDRNGLRAYAFPVNHDPAAPAVGYRFEYGGRVVVITGDTKKTDRLADYAQGADILVSEVLSFDLVGMTADSLTRLGLERPAKLITDVLDYHMDPVQVGEVARDAAAGRVVLIHIFPPAPGFLDWFFTQGVGNAYSGPVIMGEDGMFFTLDPIP
jgi:ribonuclease Z